MVMKTMKMRSPIQLVKACFLAIGRSATIPSMSKPSNEATNAMSDGG